MGATGWEYFVPYQVDVSAALHQLRKRVFLKGSYMGTVTVSKADYERALKKAGSSLQSRLDEITSRMENPNTSKRLKGMYAEMLEQLKQLDNSNSSSSKPKTIEELLKQTAESGTHSILDIIHVSAKPEFGAISPLPVSKLVEMFGTEQPSRTEIENKYEEGMLEKYVCKRCQGIYIVAYKDGLPDEIFFAGCSGD